jgi:hypothetical protein
MELRSLIAICIRWLPLIVLLGVLCGASAWLFARDEPTVYEKELSFAVRPSDRVPIESADNVVGTLANRESTIPQTLLGLLDSVPLPQASGKVRVKRSTTLRPGSLIIDVSFRSEDRDAIGPPAQSFRIAAPNVVAASYGIYELTPLGDSGPPVAVPSKILRTIALALFLGCALGVAVATLRNAATVAKHEPERGPVVMVTDRIDRIEAAETRLAEPGAAEP